MILGCFSCTSFPLEIAIFDDYQADVFETIVFTDLRSFQEFREESDHFRLRVCSVQVHRNDVFVCCERGDRNETI